MAEKLDIATTQPNFLLELAVHSLQRRLIDLDPALRELPAGLTEAPAEQKRPVRTRQNDAYIAAKSV